MQASNLLIAISLACLSGCATINANVERRETENAQAEADHTVPECRGDAECGVKWQAARGGGMANAGYKIQNENDALIETESPIPADSRMAARVTKELQSNGAYKILVTIWCGNADNCDVIPSEAALAFNKAVDAAKIPK